MNYMKTLGAMLTAATLMAAGCSPKSDTPAPTKSAGSKTSSASHDHGHGPNGGVIFDLGKYHAEFTVDHDKKECTVLILGGDEKTPKAVAVSEFTLATKETKTKEGTVVPPMTITMKPKDAVDGKASKFVGTDPGIGNVADFQGTVIGEIDGKPSQGDFKE